MIWKRAKFIREELGLPPLDPDEEQGLEQESRRGRKPISAWPIRATAVKSADERCADRTRLHSEHALTTRENTV